VLVYLVVQQMIAAYLVLLQLVDKAVSFCRTTTYSRELACGLCFVEAYKSE
jgi:hypothetical protein